MWRLLVDLCCDDAGLADIAERHGVSVEGLARWAARAGNLEMLQRLRDLVVLRAALRTARARAHAATSLQRLAADDSNPETARKACVDLLNLKIDVTEPVRDARPEPTTPGRTEQEEDTLRRLLERIGDEPP